MNVIKMNPVPKGRPRFGNGRTYTPMQTVAAERVIKQRLKGHEKIEGPVELEITFVFERPKKPTHAIPSRSDLDNLEKLFCDAANKILWTDDRMIARKISSKEYGDEGMILWRVKPFDVKTRPTHLLLSQCH